MKMVFFITLSHNVKRAVTHKNEIERGREGERERGREGGGKREIG